MFDSRRFAEVGLEGPSKIYWIMLDIGIAIFGIGAIFCLQSSQIYIIDSYQRYAVSALVGAVVLRSIAVFAFPMFAQYMYFALVLWRDD